MPQNAGSDVGGARPEYAELVALRIQEHNPGLLALAHVSMCRSQSDQATHLSVAIVRSEVEVQSVLVQLRLGNRDKEQTGRALGACSNLELVRIVIDNDPIECVTPPTTQRGGISRINDRLLPLETRAWIVATSVGRLSQNAGRMAARPDLLIDGGQREWFATAPAFADGSTERDATGPG